MPCAPFDLSGKVVLVTGGHAGDTLVVDGGYSIF